MKTKTGYAPLPHLTKGSQQTHKVILLPLIIIMKYKKVKHFRFCCIFIRNVGQLCETETSRKLTIKKSNDLAKN